MVTRYDLARFLPSVAVTVDAVTENALGERVVWVFFALSEDSIEYITNANPEHLPDLSRGLQATFEAWRDGNMGDYPPSHKRN